MAKPAQLIQYLRAAESLLKAQYAGDIDQIEFSRGWLKQTGFSFEPVDDALNVEELQEAVNDLKKKYRVVIQNVLMRQALLNQLPFISARERERGMSKNSPLSTAAYVDKLIANKVPVYEQMAAYNALINAEWKLTRKIIKGEKPKALFDQVKKLRKKLGFVG